MFLRFLKYPFLESHPFSISTVGMGEGDLNFLIKGMGKGSFTDRLLALCQKSDAPQLRVGVEGPYGHLGICLEEYEELWICAGGIGAAPMVNILMHVHKAAAAAAYESKRGIGGKVEDEVEDEDLGNRMETSRASGMCTSAG